MGSHLASCFATNHGYGAIADPRVNDLQNFFSKSPIVDVAVDLRKIHRVTNRLANFVDHRCEALGIMGRLARSVPFFDALKRHQKTDWRLGG